MYPTIIIVLVALKRSPIDTAGLSRVRRARDGHDSGTVGGPSLSTIVFHYPTSRTSGGVETGDTTEGLPSPGDRSSSL